MPEDCGKSHTGDEANDCCHPPKVIDPAELKLLLPELTNRVPDGVSDRDRDDERNQDSHDRHPVSGRLGKRDFGGAGIQAIDLGQVGKLTGYRVQISSVDDTAVGSFQISDFGSQFSVLGLRYSE